MVATRHQAKLHLRTRAVARAAHVQLPDQTTRVRWQPPAYSDWPSQDNTASFTRFIHEHYDRFKQVPPSNWKNGCVQTSTAMGKKFKLLPHQQFVASIISPATKVKRMLIASSTGSGKTMIVTSIICNFLDKSLYPTQRPKPSQILIVTQNATLKEQLYDAIQNTAPCVSQQFRTHPEIKQGRMKEENHPYWWAEKWLKSHDISVQVLTYGQAVRRPPSTFNNAVVIMDEVHTLVDTSALAKSQQSAVLKLRGILEGATPQVLVGLTGSPLGQSWQHFLGLHNLFAAPQDRITEEEFLLLFLEKITLPNASGVIQRCMDKDTETEAYIWNPKSLDAIHALTRKIASYLYYYDAAFDTTRFAQPENMMANVFSDPQFIKNALTTTAKKRTLRATFGRTRLVATDNIHEGTDKVLARIQTLDDLDLLSPVVRQLITNLQKRKRKAVVYSDVQDAFGSQFTYEVLRKFQHELFGGNQVSLYQLTSRDGVSKRTKTVKDFNAHSGTGSSSAILVLGPQFSTGVDVHGGVGEMHILNVLPNDALQTQVRGRVQRNCSHGKLPHSDWTISYYQYKNLYEDEVSGIRSCDMVVEEYRRNIDSVMRALAAILQRASLGCKAMAKHHQQNPEECFSS